MSENEEEEYIERTHVEYKCNKCGSKDIKFDAWAIWNEEEQDFNLDNVFEHSYCVECDKTCTLE